MATGICNICGKEVQWRGGRGCRIADARCSCGGTVRGKTLGVPGKNVGRKMETCQVCGRRAYLFLHPQEDYRVQFPPYGQGEGGKQKTHPAGSPCCSTHNPRPLDDQENFGIPFRSPEWCEIQNRHERFLHAAAGGKGKLTVWAPMPETESAGGQRA